MNRFNPESMATAIVNGITGKTSNVNNTTMGLGRKGSGNPEIEKLQSSLNSLINAGLVVDGTSGPATEKAIKNHGTTSCRWYSRKKYMVGYTSNL